MSSRKPLPLRNAGQQYNSLYDDRSHRRVTLSEAFKNKAVKLYRNANFSHYKTSAVMTGVGAGVALGGIGFPPLLPVGGIIMISGVSSGVVKFVFDKYYPINRSGNLLQKSTIFRSLAIGGATALTTAGIVVGGTIASPLLLTGAGLSATAFLAHQIGNSARFNKKIQYQDRIVELDLLAKHLSGKIQHKSHSSSSNSYNNQYRSSSSRKSIQHSSSSASGAGTIISGLGRIFSDKKYFDISTSATNALSAAGIGLSITNLIFDIFHDKHMKKELKSNLGRSKSNLLRVYKELDGERFSLVEKLLDDAIKNLSKNQSALGKLAHNKDVIFALQKALLGCNLTNEEIDKNKTKIIQDLTSTMTPLLSAPHKDGVLDFDREKIRDVNQKNFGGNRLSIQDAMPVIEKLITTKASESVLGKEFNSKTKSIVTTVIQDLKIDTTSSPNKKNFEYLLNQMVVDCFKDNREAIKTERIQKLVVEKIKTILPNYLEEKNSLNNSIIRIPSKEKLSKQFEVKGQEIVHSSDTNNYYLSRALEVVGDYAKKNVDFTLTPEEKLAQTKITTNEKPKSTVGRPLSASQPHTSGRTMSQTQATRSQ